MNASPRRSAASTQPPLARGWPVIGNALPMLRNPMPFFVEQYQRLGPIFRVRAAHQELLVIAGPEAADRVRESGYDDFASGQMWQPFLGQLGAESFLLSMDGPPHQARRRLLKAGFSRDYLAKRLDRVVAVVREHLIEACRRPSVETTPWIKHVIVDVMGRVHASHALGSAMNDLITFHDELIAGTTGVRPQLLWRRPAHRARRRRVMATMRDVITHHRHSRAAVPDMIDELVAAYDRGETGMSEAELVLATLGPFVAGKDTAAPTSSFLLYALLANPDARRRVQAEADALFADGVPDAKAIGDSPALSGALLETLRRYPAAPAFVRTAARDIEFEGYPIAAGQRVVIAASVAHFLPRLYPDPERFDIDRFAPPRREHKQRGAFSPYGLGPHICLGAALAETLIKTTVATLLHDCDVHAVDPSYRLRTNSVPNPSPDAGFRIRLTRRARA